MTALLDRALDLPSIVFAVLVMAVAWAAMVGAIALMVVAYLTIGEVIHFVS